MRAPSALIGLRHFVEPVVQEHAAVVQQLRASTLTEVV